MTSFLLIDYSLVSNHIDSKRLNGLGYSIFVHMGSTQDISIEILQTHSNKIMLLVKYLVNYREFQPLQLLATLVIIFFE